MSLSPRGGRVVLALALLAGVISGCTLEPNSGGSTDLHTIRCKEVPGSDPVSCEGGYYVFPSKFDAVLWAAQRPSKPDPKVSQARFDKGWKTGIRYACNWLYGGPGPFGQWNVVVDPFSGDAISHKVLAWVNLGGGSNDQLVRLTYRLCYSSAKSGPPHITA